MTKCNLIIVKLEKCSNKTGIFFKFQSNVENVSPQIIRQVTKELADLVKDPPEGIQVYPNEEDITEIHATIDGPGMQRFWTPSIKGTVNALWRNRFASHNISLTLRDMGVLNVSSLYSFDNLELTYSVPHYTWSWNSPFYWGLNTFLTHC